MDGIAKSLQVLWENKPGAVVLLVLGFFVFLFLVVDTWHHKRHRKRPQRTGAPEHPRYPH